MPRDQIFVATTASSRRPSSASESELSAPPYIGDESNTRAHASSAAPTTSVASEASPLNVFHVPSPTTGPSRRSSISLRARARAGLRRRRRAKTTAPAPPYELAPEPSSGEGAGEEPRLLVGAAAHVRERQPVARLPPVAGLDLAARLDPVGRLETGRPGHGHAASAEREHRTRVMRDTAVAVPLVGARDPGGQHRSPAPGPPPSAPAAFAASAAERPPWPSVVPVPRIPGPIEQTAASQPAPLAHASADAKPTHSASPPKHGPAETVVATRPRSRSSRTVSDSGRASA